VFMSDVTDQNILRLCIQKVATGPEYSKDLSFEEARHSMQQILKGNTDPVQTAIYFIALRMKRETNEENCGILQAVKETSTQVTAAVDELVDVCDPYDGYTRSVPASPFIAPVLAALGVNAVSHGLNAVGPKFGATHYKVLKAAGLDVSLTPEQAAAQVENIGWAYVDQSQFAPALHDLIPLRQRMIKRQVMTTIETMLGPIRGQQKTHLMGGYVHKAYPPIYAALARHSQFDSAMFIRGVEGGVIPSLQQTGRLFYYKTPTEDIQQQDLSPKDIGIDANYRAVPLPDDLPEVHAADNIATTVDSEALARFSAELGQAAMQGEKGLMYDALVYSAAICLTHLGRYATMQDSANAVRQVLDSGAAWETLQAAAKLSH
jgi:anthranilate phosphoribosyltransferase